MAEKETPLNVDDISSEPLVANSVLSTDNPVVPEGTPATGGEDIKPKTPSPIRYIQYRWSCATSSHDAIWSGRNITNDAIKKSGTS